MICKVTVTPQLLYETGRIAATMDQVLLKVSWCKAPPPPPANNVARDKILAGSNADMEASMQTPSLVIFNRVLNIITF